jgi:hypothetical protein
VAVASPRNQTFPRKINILDGSVRCGASRSDAFSVLPIDYIVSSITCPAFYRPFLTVAICSWAHGEHMECPPKPPFVLALKTAKMGLRTLAKMYFIWYISGAEWLSASRLFSSAL